MAGNRVVSSLVMGCALAAAISLVLPLALPIAVQAAEPNERPAGPPPAAVRVATVVEQNVAPTARLVGTVQAASLVPLAARQGAAVSEVWWRTVIALRLVRSCCARMRVRCRLS